MVRQNCNQQTLKLRLTGAPVARGNADRGLVIGTGTENARREAEVIGPEAEIVSTESGVETGNVTTTLIAIGTGTGRGRESTPRPDGTSAVLSNVR